MLTIIFYLNFYFKTILTSEWHKWARRNFDVPTAICVSAPFQSVAVNDQVYKGLFKLLYQKYENYDNRMHVLD